MSSGSRVGEFIARDVAPWSDEIDCAGCGTVLESVGPDEGFADGETCRECGDPLCDECMSGHAC